VGGIVGVFVRVDDRAVGLAIDEGLDLPEARVGVLFTGAAGIGKALQAAVDVDYFSLFNYLRKPGKPTLSSKQMKATIVNSEKSRRPIVAF